MLKRQLVHQSQRRAAKDRRVATRLQSAAPTQFARVLVACSLCTNTSGDDGMRKASTGMLEKGTQTPSPSPDLIPAETSTENLHWDWHIGWGHFITSVVSGEFLGRVVYQLWTYCRLGIETRDSAHYGDFHQ